MHIRVMFPDSMLIRSKVANDSREELLEKIIILNERVLQANQQIDLLEDEMVSMSEDIDMLNEQLGEQ